jgi:hypothetical protein
MTETSIRAPDGRAVVLTDRRWRHIISGHPEPGPHWREVVEAVRKPSHVRPGRRLAEEWFYGPGGPSRWVKVVVHWEIEAGVVVTAFARRSLP